MNRPKTWNVVSWCTYLCGITLVTASIASGTEDWSTWVLLGLLILWTPNRVFNYFPFKLENWMWNRKVCKWLLKLMVGGKEYDNIRREFEDRKSRRIPKSL